MIEIAFCFDEKLTDQVRVTVASLLDASQADGVHYHIYCVCTRQAAYIEASLMQIVETRDPESMLTVKAADNIYQDAYEVRGISAGTYLRLMLHRLLPDVDMLIYTDVDVLFCASLKGIWQTDMEGYVLAAVKGAVNLADKWEWNSDRPYWKQLEGIRGRYINAGVTLMNLAEVRRRNLEEKWDIWSKERLYYQDQDILNLTCQDAMRYLPPKYNRLAYMERKDYDTFVSEGIFTEKECRDALDNPVIIHYAGDKPWKRYDTNLGNLWWDYVNSQSDLQGLFDEEKARKYHGPTFSEKVVRKIKKKMSKEKL